MSSKSDANRSESQAIMELQRENEQLRQTVAALRQAVSILTESSAGLFQAAARSSTAQLRAGELVSDALGIWTQPAIPNN